MFASDFVGHVLLSLSLAARIQESACLMPNQSDKKPDSPSRKDTKVEARIPEELRDRVEKKARSRGWSLASVIRALLELWAEEDLVSPDQIGDANDRAPRSRKKKKDSSSG